MKHVKKLASVLLAMVMVMAMTMTAFAEGETTPYSITIKNSTEGHTYEAYQIFTGDLSGGVLSNIEWGSGISEAGQTALLSFGKGNGEAAYASAAELAAALTKNNIADFAKEAAKYLGTYSSTDIVTAEGTYVISDLAAGYYLVKDADKSLSGNDNDAYTSYILKVVKNETVTPKSDVPEMEKKVDDKNDSKTSEDNVNWQDSADYDIGDEVPFKLTGTVASNYDDYKTYYFAFHDVEEDGLTFNADSVKVYVDSTLITSGYEVVTNNTDGCSFEVIFKDLKNISIVNAESKITVEYTSTLNSNANIGSEGNKNKAHLEFSNNPNEEQKGEGDEWEKPGTGKTPDDVVIVFTYETIIDKVDENGTALEGAEFTLYKYDPTNKNALTSGDYVGYVALTMVKAESGTEFSFTGLDDGKYVLVETTTPAGYNTIEPIEFTVTATHTVLQEEDENKTITLKTLTVTSDDAVFSANVEAGKVTKLNNTEKDVASGQIYTEVVNQSGSTLPETGGMGTTIFYVIGSILVLGAAVVMITRKRMAK